METISCGVGSACSSPFLFLVCSYSFILGLDEYVYFFIALWRREIDCCSLMQSAVFYNYVEGVYFAVFYQRKTLSGTMEDVLDN